MSLVSNSDSEPFTLPHPLLDNANRIQRIIANPVYDKLTKSRAAQIRQHHSTIHIQPLPSKNNQKPKTRPSLRNTTKQKEKTTLPTVRPTQSHHYPPPFRLPIPYTNHRSNHPSRSQSVISTVSTDKSNILEGSLRYVQTTHGFEVQRYSAKNWLTIDMISKAACQNDERIFREMMERENRAKVLADSVFTADYYRQRWHQLLNSYRQGHLTHEEWAKQNYQLHCLKKFYLNASERELLHQEQIDELERRIRADNAFHRWKELKDEENYERHSHTNTANDQILLDSPHSSPLTETSVRRSQSASIANIFSSSSHTNKNPSEKHGIEKIELNPKKPTIDLNVPNIYDRSDRWSLSAMIKRIVGLAEPLPTKQKPVYNFRRDHPLTSIKI